SRGGTSSSLESRLVRCLVVPTRNRLIDPSIEPCCCSGLEAQPHVLHAVDMYYATAYKANEPWRPTCQRRRRKSVTRKQSFPSDSHTGSLTGSRTRRRSAAGR